MNYQDYLKTLTYLYKTQNMDSIRWGSTLYENCKKFFLNSRYNGMWVGRGKPIA